MKTRFVYQILYNNAALFLYYLRVIDQRANQVEDLLHETYENKDLIQLYDLEKCLVYFTTALKSNEVVLEKLRKHIGLRHYEEDEELLEDVIIENKQAIEMTAIYRDIINGTRELLSTIIDNRLNNVMKYLTSITLVMAIPTVISGIYGMNVSGKWMPLSETPYGFYIVCGIMVLICVIVLLILRKRKMV